MTRSNGRFYDRQPLQFDQIFFFGPIYEKVIKFCFANLGDISSVPSVALNRTNSNEDPSVSVEWWAIKTFISNPARRNKREREREREQLTPRGSNSSWDRRGSTKRPSRWLGVSTSRIWSHSYYIQQNSRHLWSSGYEVPSACVCALILAQNVALALRRSSPLTPRVASLSTTSLNHCHTLSKYCHFDATRPQTASIPFPIGEPSIPTRLLFHPRHCLLISSISRRRVSRPNKLERYKLCDQSAKLALAADH